MIEVVKSRATSQREVPPRDPAFADVSLEALRQLRQTLQTEETRVSYWRRLVQARLDVLESQDTGRGAAAVHDRVQRLRQVLSPKGPSPSRMSHVDIFPADDTPPLPDLGELWSREIPETDEAALHQMRQDLGIAELQLSTYRSELHRRLGAATGELVTRYNEDPTLCFGVLPLDR